MPFTPDSDGDTAILTEEQTSADLDSPWHVVVFNDPVNLMSFVTLVFRRIFGYSEEKATKSSKPLVTQVVAPNRPMAAPVVKKQVSTLESADKVRYSDDELAEFRDLINKKLDEARKDYDLLKQTLANTDNNGTDDTSPSFKMIEDGSETLSREETAQLASRQEKFIKHLEDALLRIRNKTYGICRVTGRLISKERLRLVPHATLSIEAKQQMGN